MNNTGMVKMLVEELADVDAIDAEGWSTLHLAARNGNVERLRLLKAAGSWLHTRSKRWQTALHCAVIGESAPAVEEILRWKESDVNAMGNGRVTPLHHAVCRGFLRIAELLIEAGADVNAVTELEPGVETSVLSMAAFTDNPEVVELLLKAGAEVDPSGDVLLEAARDGHQRAVKVLLQARDWPAEVKAAARKLMRLNGEL
jgi:cytohesin